MRLDYSNIAHNLATGVFPRLGAVHRLSLRRVTALIVSCLLFCYARATLLLFAAFDELFFRGYRRQVVQRPLFVVGNFRSGTTLLINALHAGAPHTRSHNTWEIYLAPTVSQRLFFSLLARIDRRLGGRAAVFVHAINERHFKSLALHPVDLFGPEEDGGVLLHIWSGFFTWFAFARRGVLPEMAHIDSLPKRRRDRIVRFYRRVVKKTLYAHLRRYPGRDVPVFLSKNPSFTGMIATLADAFPDSRFVNIVRDMEPTRRSTIAWFRFWFALLGTRDTAPELEMAIDRLMNHWYRYPRRVFATMEETRHATIALADLVSDPRRTLHRLVDRLDLHWLRDPAVLERQIAKMDRQYGTVAA